MSENTDVPHSVSIDHTHAQSGKDTSGDEHSIGNTLSHIVGALSPSSATTSPTHTNVTTTTFQNSDHPATGVKNLEVNTTTESSSGTKAKENEPVKLYPNPIHSIQPQPGVKFTQTDELEASFTGISTRNTDPLSMVLPDSNPLINNAIPENGKNYNDDNNNNNYTESNGSNGVKNTDTSSNVMSGINAAFRLFNLDNKHEEVESNNSDLSKKNSMVSSSPLLSSTPPTVTKSLIKSYPFLILILKVLNILTWNDDSTHLSIFLVLLTTFFILYYEPLIIYLGHLLPVFALWIYSECKKYIISYQSEHSTLDDIIQTMSLISKRSDILISPIVELDLTAGDLKRLLFTTVFLSPVYVAISFFILPPNKMLLSLSILTLTYHSRWSKITRSLLWKSRSFRLFCFYLTGLDFENSGLSKSSTLFNLNQKLSKRFGKKSKGDSLSSDGAHSNSKSSVRFTYVIYENQRRWLGVGWTPNLLSYERTPWTDDFLNESEPIDSFELPQLPLSADLQDLADVEHASAKVGADAAGDDMGYNKGIVWRWIDKTWRLDLTNDGSIQLSSTKPKTTANPKSDDGWIYYDNTWKNPSTEDGFSKYTRRRRWIRTAELVYIGKDGKDIPIKKVTNASNKSAKIADFPNAKSVKFNSADSAPPTTASESGAILAEGDGKPIKKGGLKRSDSHSDVKKRKSLRFEDSSDET